MRTGVWHVAAIGAVMFSIGCGGGGSGDVRDTGAPELNGSLLNLGTTDATVTALLISLYDLDRRLIWVDWIVLPEAVRPGLEELFTASLTTRDQLEPVETPARTFANGLLDDAATPPAALVSLPPASGYAGLTVQPVVFLRESS